MVAGMSSRFGGRVKQFARIGVNDEALIEHSLGQALEIGFSKIIFVVGDKTEEGFRKMFENEYRGVPVFYARQGFDSSIRSKPWGTVDALCAAKEFIDCSFVVCNGDDIYGETSFRILFDHLQEGVDSATVGFRLGEVLSEACGVNRGIIESCCEGYLKGIRETIGIEKDGLEDMGLNEDDLCNMNIMGFRKEAIDMLDEKLKLFKEENSENCEAECFLPTEISGLIEKGLINIKVYSAEDKWMGITGPEDVDFIKNSILCQ